MAGHSKFKNIMHKKGAQDAKRAKVFSRHAREISVAARGGADPASNAALRQAILVARSLNMPNANIERAIKSVGEKDNLESARYEGYGPKGTAFVLDVLTDNKNRSFADLRSVFNKKGGNLGEQGSVSFLFDYVGVIFYPKDVAQEDKMLEATLESGGTNCEGISCEDKDYWKITTEPGDFQSVQDELVKHFDIPASLSLVWEPKELMDLPDDDMEAVVDFVECLEDIGDVQKIFSNVSYATPE